MKLLISTSIATLASASQLADMMAELVNSTNSEKSHARNFGFSGPVGNYAELYADYGCWCRMGANNGYVGHGAGETQDAFDAECKLLHDNYACLEVEESTCDPFNIQYDRPGNQNLGNPSYWINELMRADLTASEIETECITANGGTFAPLCDRNACIIESTFLHKFFQLLAANEIDTNTYGSANFDQSTCTMGNNFSSWSSSRGTKRCCGEYSSYKQIYFDGSKGCCNNQNVYSLTAKKCCANGNVRDMAASCN
jgi:hypothetical protein